MSPRQLLQHLIWVFVGRNFPLIQLVLPQSTLGSLDSLLWSKSTLLYGRLVWSLYRQSFIFVHYCDRFFGRSLPQSTSVPFNLNSAWASTHFSLPISLLTYLEAWLRHKFSCNLIYWRVDALTQILHIQVLIYRLRRLFCAKCAIIKLGCLIFGFNRIVSRLVILAGLLLKAANQVWRGLKAVKPSRILVPRYLLVLIRLEASLRNSAGI